VPYLRRTSRRCRVWKRGRAKHPVLELFEGVCLRKSLQLQCLVECLRDCSHRVSDQPHRPGGATHCFLLLSRDLSPHYIKIMIRTRKKSLGRLKPRMVKAPKYQKKIDCKRRVEQYREGNDHLSSTASSPRYPSPSVARGRV